MTADDLANFIETIAQRTVHTYLPDNLDDVLMTRFTGGARDQELTTLREPSFQVFIRDRDPVQAESLAQTFETRLHGAQETIGGHACSIYSKHEPIPLGVDEKQRHMYSLNFEMVYQT